MQRSRDETRHRTREQLAGRVLLLLFGFGVLTFLVAIDRAEWFAIRPATGTSIALSHASAAEPGRQQTSPEVARKP